MNTKDPEVMELLKLAKELKGRIEKLEERVAWIETYAEGIR